LKHLRCHHDPFGMPQVCAKFVLCQSSSRATICAPARLGAISSRVTDNTTWRCHEAARHRWCGFASTDRHRRRPPEDSRQPLPENANCWEARAAQEARLCPDAGFGLTHRGSRVVATTGPLLRNGWLGGTPRVSIEHKTLVWAGVRHTQWGWPWRHKTKAKSTIVTFC
jgi:hypothetical protein